MGALQEVAGGREPRRHGPGRHSLTSLDDIKPLYFLPKDDLAEEALIPSFRAAEGVDCMVGFFSSASLATLAPGLATFINETSGRLRLIVSPYLSAADQAGIEAGVRSLETAAADAFERMIVTEDLLQRHALRCLSYLMRVGRIDLRIAVMKDALFHPKVWLFGEAGNTLAVHGSGNMTHAGIRRNFEQITVSRAWADPTQRYIVDKLAFQFERLWDNLEDDCVVLTAPKAVADQILQAYPADAPPTEAEYRALFQRAAKAATVAVAPSAEPPASRPEEFSIPAGLRYDDGPFEHQGRAVRAWCEAGYRGVLEMATGSGKTITSMVGAYRLFEQHGPLLIVVAAPYVPLIEQWCDEIEPFGLKPVNLTVLSGAQARTRALQQVKRRLRLGLSRAEAVVVSHDTLCTPEFSQAVAAFDCARLLIADEAHNLGRPSFVDNPPDFFEYRLALSATPVRQYDQEGTDKLFDFFGEVVFRFPLEEAIGRCLVEYDYHVHPVYLTQTEMESWYELTGKIRENAWRQEGGKPDEYLTKLFRDRRALLETAAGKIEALSRALKAEDVRSLRHTLIYTSDKGPAQLDDVNRLLRDRSLLFHQLTAEETADRGQTRRIIQSFQDAEIQVLTAKRVLDEGVNIPQICKAFILASTTVGRQWIQRRGRLLRTCSAIGKTHSVIHDFIALPPASDGNLDPDAKSLVRSELKRVQEFASLARNAGRADGPLAVIKKLVDAAYL